MVQDSCTSVRCQFKVAWWQTMSYVLLGILIVSWIGWIYRAVNIDQNLNKNVPKAECTLHDIDSFNQNLELNLSMDE